ncbi:MAG: hypothetical protein AB7T10_03750 [bacterium]
MKTEKHNELLPRLEPFPGIDRAALIVKPKKPFIDWLFKTSREYEKPENQIKLEIIDTEGMDSKQVYLIPLYDDNEKYEKFLKKHCIEIFNNELGGWYTDPDMWPKNRSWKEFQEWFEYEIQTMVCDTIPETDIGYDD